MAVSAVVSVAKGCAWVPSALESSAVADTKIPNSSEITHASVPGLSVPSHGGGGAPPVPALAVSEPPSPFVPEVPEVPDAPALPLAPPLAFSEPATESKSDGQSRRVVQSVKLLHD